MKTAKKHVGHGISQFELTTDLLQNLNKFSLSPTAKLVLLELSSHYNNSNIVFPSMNYISDVLGVSLSSVKQAIKDLINEGLIIKSKRSKVSGNHNLYAFTSKVQISACEPSEIKPFKRSENNLFMKEQKREEINLTDQEEKILLDYASKKGVANKFAYVSAIKKNGGAKAIIDEYRRIENNKNFMLNETKRIQREIEALKDVPQVDSNFFANVRKNLIV